MDDPLSETGVQIRRGVASIDLSLSYKAGSWELKGLTYRFKHKGGDMALIGFDSTTVNRATGAVVEYSENLLARRGIKTEGRIDQDRSKTTVKRLPRRPVIFMSEMASALDYRPAEGE